MNWLRVGSFLALSFCTISASTAQAQVLGRNHGFLKCNLVNRLLNGARTQQIAYPSLDGTVCFPTETVNQATEPQVYTEQVPYTVTKSYTVAEPSYQIKEDIKRVKEKLDSIQPGQNPSLKNLQDELKEIKELLRKSSSPSSEILRRIEASERIVEGAIRSGELKSLELLSVYKDNALLLAIEHQSFTHKEVDNEPVVGTATLIE